ncbi:MAG: 2-C-methyl-D-erythritol 4-phosphate cytidylyltransferase [Ferruginibacter sp.]|nr:2-C-methyl-D-erythritol 4-phosphate cytidylyltransferase [Ferruginibacter sp.]
MKKFAVIVAGGKGLRMNHPVPKQFHLLNGKPVLYYTILAFLKAYNDMEVILVLPDNNTLVGKEIIDAYFGYSRVRIVVGGSTRFHSVKHGLSLVEEESVVMVHDAVRCMVSPELIRRCYEATIQFGSAVPVIDMADSLRWVDDEGNKPLDRSKVKAVQTPQAFYSKIILPAFQIDYKERFTDEASVVEEFGMSVNLIQGEEKNIKLTTPADFIYAEIFLKQFPST